SADKRDNRGGRKHRPRKRGTRSHREETPASEGDEEGKDGGPDSLDGSAGKRAGQRGRGYDRSCKVAADPDSLSGRQEMAMARGDEQKHAKPEARGGGERNGGRAAAAKGGPSGRQSQDADGGDEGDNAEPEARGGGKRNGGRAAAAKGGPSGRQSQDADGGDEGDHAEPEARGGGKRNGGRAAAAKGGPSGRQAQDADGGDEGDHAEPEVHVGGKRNGGMTAAAKGGPSGRQSQDADGGDEGDHAEPECRGVNDRDEDEPAAVTDGKENGREAVIPYKRRNAVDRGSRDRKARQARQGPNVHVSSSSSSEEGSSDSESGSSSGSEEVYENEDEEEEDEEDEELEPESEDGEEARPLKRRSVRKLKKGNGKRKSERGRVKSCKQSVRRAKPHGKRQRPRFEARIVGVRSKAKRELDFYESMGLRCPSSSHDRKAADPYAVLREPMDSAGKGDPMAWGSARFGREATDPPAKHTGDHAVHVKIEGATKRYEPSAAAAANDGVGGGVWANALGECGGGVEGSMWDVRESRGGGGDAKMDPATKEGRGESMGTPGASTRPDLAGGKTVEQLMRELAQRDCEIAALKARAGSKGPVKPCTPPSRPPPLASLSSGPSAGGLDPGVAPESPATVDVPVRRLRGMPTPKLLKVYFAVGRDRMCLEWPDDAIDFYPTLEQRLQVLYQVISETHIINMTQLREAMEDKNIVDVFKRAWTSSKNDRGFHLKRRVLVTFGKKVEGLRAADLWMGTKKKKKMWKKYQPRRNQRVSSWGNNREGLPFANGRFVDAVRELFRNLCVGRRVCVKAYHIAWSIMV
ncbi:unnamed protein product, partial [Closterium sp. Naga37s-1]